MYGLVKESSKASLCLCAKNGYSSSLCCSDNFMMIIISSMNVVNTKVVDNFLILLVLKCYDFRPDGLGVIDFRSLLSGFACPLNRSE